MTTHALSTGEIELDMNTPPIVSARNPTNARRRPHIGLMLGHRRKWEGWKPWII